MNMELKAKADSATNSFPLSPLQHGMLFHNLSAGAAGVDIEQIICRLRENLDVAALHRAWQNVVARQAILRTTFHWQGLAGPHQTVHSEVVMEIQFADWRGKAQAEQAVLFEAVVHNDRRRGFDLSATPPNRVAIFRLGDADYQLLWTFHHLLLDGRAVVMVFNEVFAFYEALVRGENLELPQPPRYCDYVDWLNRQDLTKAEGFWRATLKDFTPPPPISIGQCSRREREPREELTGEQQISLSQPVTTALKCLARKNDFTPNTLLQGAWALLLARYTRENDVAFGVIRACRRSDFPAAVATVGLFINTLPMRVRIEPELPLLTWLKTVRASWTALRDFEHTPLVNIQNWSDGARGQPLFESLFNFQDPSWDAALRAQGGKWAAREFGIRSQSNYPLVVDAYGGDALLIKILYQRNRFDDDAIARMLGHYKELLEGMAASPDAKVGDLPMLTEGEQRQLLVEWNNTAADFPRDKCVHELFEEQARRTPDALAVADSNNQLTYRELNERADELAQHLSELGVASNICVGICTNRSVVMVVAKLAVWKAGGAYVPFDPSCPAERLEFMLKDAKTPVLLTEKSLCGSFQFKIPDLKLLCVDELPDETENNSRQKSSHHKSNPPSAIRHPSSHDLAYVIYTSGSTGVPKGVEIEHRSLVNLVTWHQRTYQVTLGDRATQIATPAFDASIWELWPYLTCGASIHIPNEEARLSPKKLLAWLAAEQITLTFIPTPIAETMLDEPWPEDCAVRAVLTGGDKLHRAPGKNFHCTLINHYGPTENTVVTTCASVPPMDDDAQPPPIGRPIANTRAFILDPNLQPVPVGVSGELHISGDGLARGYRNRPDLTVEKFIPNPFSPEPNARLYKTGDLVRWLPDGQIEFQGRMDSQVKVRGQRIELGEIEIALARHPSVREAVVLPREDARGKTRLAAYLLLRPEKRSGNTKRKPELEIGKIMRRFLREKLPDAMVPSAFMVLAALPLTPNGKIDRKALPAPVFEVETDFVVPRTPAEKKLADIWCEVLGIQRAGINDNFFELGGHSLTATQVVSRVCDAFQIALPLRELFDLPTIAALSEKIEELENCAKNPAVRPAISGFHNDERPLSFAQERIWFADQMEPGLALNNIPEVIQLRGSLNVAALEQALTEIVRRHETFRTTFRKQNGRPVAVMEPPGPFALPVVDLSTLPETGRSSKARVLADETSRQPFDLTQSPLLRAKLLRLTDEEHWLLLTTHHIVCDGWALGIFHHELAALYNAYLQNTKPSLPELPMNYGNFIQWQRKQLRGEMLEKQLDFWVHQLDGAQTTLDLPTDRPRPAIQTYHGATKCFALPQKLYVELTRLSRKEKVTPFMLLLAAMQTLLHRYSGQEDILLGSPVAGRTRPETENLIGLFLNMLVLRGDLSGDPSFRELLKRTRKTALDVYAHQELPFEKLVDALQPQRDLSRSPLFQVLFVLQNEPLCQPALTGLKPRLIHTHSGTAKFDLMFSLEESDGSLGGFVEYNTDLFDESAIGRMLGNFETLLAGIVADPEQRLSQLPLLTDAERRQILVEWNDTQADFPQDKCVHQLFEDQVGRTPDDVALIFQDEQLTYRQLNERADEVAQELIKHGIGPDVRVGICVERSLEMMVGLLAILKAGGCYVPLDPTYPKDRLAFMLKDSQAEVLLTQTSLRDNLKFEISNLKVLCVDKLFDEKRGKQLETVSSFQSPILNSKNLAYVLYTSGSTGRPKGVMVTHRNVANFFVGMDRVLGTEPGVWLAVTSISFDISVLELFWTLTRGFKVIIQPGADPAQTLPTPQKSTNKIIDFSMLYFANTAEGGAADKYRLLIESAKFADEHGFAAVWTPERHFHPFGGLYPNPSVTGAALAMITKRIQIRAGSVVLPLHHPIRVAEEWSVVDNLSHGRVAVSFASGWHDRDFALAPENYPRRKEILFGEIETVRKLWRGESLCCRAGADGRVKIEIFPRPLQKELPVWITASGDPETFRKAGELGANLLTHLLGQTFNELAAKIRTYRAACVEHHNGEGRVAVMLHTFAGENMNDVREKVRGPFCDYLKSSADLLKNMANGGLRDGIDLKNISEQDLDAVVQHAFDRYYQTCGLLGTPESCLPLVNRLKAIGVDELACLIDFGVDADSVIANLQNLRRLKELSNSTPALNSQWRSLPQQIQRHGVTHMQCTPSFARTQVLVPESQLAMRSLRKLLLGGEALPVSLARQLREILRGQFINMYGPTETTIWSATHRVNEIENTIPIGRPLANTQIYILDKNLQPVPGGVPGEILIGGDGVARGYLNRPELTAEKFVRDPFSPNPDARLYRTGDLGRFRADGTIEFLGRLDNQVKIRGHRVELGEIELALEQHPAVRDAVVMAREDSPGDKRLVAYLVPTAKIEISELRRFLKDKLPEAMMPSAFVVLAELPLTPNGKVDRKALPPPETQRPKLETDYAAPQTDLEKNIAGIWRELLRVEQVGLHDNFFDLGGNSLLVVEAQAKLRGVSGLDLPVVKLFQYPTIGSLATFLSRRENVSHEKPGARGRRKQAAFAQLQKQEEEVPV